MFDCLAHWHSVDLFAFVVFADLFCRFWRWSDWFGFQEKVGLGIRMATAGSDVKTAPDPGDGAGIDAVAH